MAKEISLALGGGGIKGIAHIGVLMRLEELGFKIQAIAGTSVGSLVGALYCAGYTPAEIANLVNDFDQKSFFFNRVEGRALLSLHSITQILANKLGEITFNDLKIKFACPAVDIKTSREFVFSENRVIDAVLSSIAVPGIFPPRTIEDKDFVDGAVLNPVPVNLARWLRPDLPVIASCLTSRPDDWVHMPDVLPINAPIPIPIIEQFSRLRIAQAFTIFTKSIDVSSRMLTELRMSIEKPDVIIRPDVDKYGMLDQVNPEELIETGIKSVDKEIDSISKTLAFGAKIKRKWQQFNQPTLNL
ncbi:MAG: patatin-like phospholipase family protein [Anaerolineae bacterium]|nr:patatin-like phospholipase family protein [Anaerolineae bacterium]